MEVPVDHVTNGVHIHSWGSPEARSLWERAIGKYHQSAPAGTPSPISMIPICGVSGARFADR